MEIPSVKCVKDFLECKMEEVQYSYEILSTKFKDVPDIGNILRQVSYFVVGTLEGHERKESRTTSLPQQGEGVIMNDDTLTTEKIIAAIEQYAEDLPVVKNYIKDMLLKEVI